MSVAGAYVSSLRAVTAKSHAPPYRVQVAIDDPKTFSYHTKVSLLWKDKWRMPASQGVYPFVDGNVEDFDPIFEELVKRSGDDTSICYDPDAYAEPFLPVGEDLVKRGEEAEKSGDTEKAKELYLRAGTVFRISRFPINRSKLSQKAWELNKDAYLRASKYLDPPNQEIHLPFRRANTEAGDKTTDIPIYLRLPKGEKPPGGYPILIFLCGIDAYRTDHGNRTEAHCNNGFATISLEIPGTGDCPGSRTDPSSADRVWSSLFDWIESSASEYGFNPKKAFARGVSTGGYYAFRIAHTHASKLLGVVAQGGWSHYAMAPEWIRAMNHMEYPYALGDAWVYKHGYETMEEMINDAPLSKYSLWASGILDMPSCRLFIVNGMIDSIFPIEDSIMVATKGRVKDVRFMEGKPHMGNPGAEPIVYDWINEVLAGSETGAKTFDA